MDKKHREHVIFGVRQRDYYLPIGESVCDQRIDDIVKFYEAEIEAVEKASEGFSERIKEKIAIVDWGGCNDIKYQILSLFPPKPKEESRNEVNENITYGEPCPICNSRIDSTGLCACGAGGS